jgi:O-antigen ligase
VFLDNPVVGAGLSMGSEKEERGQHSSWMDALALYGLLGGVPYIMFHLLVFRRLFKSWLGNRQNAIYWGCLLCCALFIFYGIFNVTTQATTLALFLYASGACGQRLAVPAGCSVYSLRNNRYKRKLKYS